MGASSLTTHSDMQESSFPVECGLIPGAANDFFEDMVLLLASIRIASHDSPGVLGAYSWTANELLIIPPQ
jgi:hypothetical protein